MIQIIPLIFLLIELCCLCKGVSIHWLGDFVFVESGLSVRVKFDLSNTVYVTVTAEHLAATRGLCGIYNNNADGRPMCNSFTACCHSSFPLVFPWQPK